MSKTKKLLIKILMDRIETMAHEIEDHKSHEAFLEDHITDLKDLQNNLANRIEILADDNRELHSQNNRLQPLSAKEVEQLMRPGWVLNNKINSIKAVRQITGLGLKESKDIVEKSTHEFQEFVDQIHKSYQNIGDYREPNLGDILKEALHPSEG